MNPLFKEPVDHPTVDDLGWVEEYVLGRLGPEAEARFEEHFLDCDECLERLELTRRIHSGLQQTVSPEESLERSLAEAPPGERGEVFRADAVVARRSAPSAALWLAAAALLALAISPWMIFPARTARLESELAAARAPRAIAATWSLDAERSGAPGSTVVRTGSEPEWIVLRVALPPTVPEGPLRVAVRTAGSASDPTAEPPRWRSEDLEPDASGRVSIGFDSSWLEPGPYRLVVTSADSAVGDSDLPVSEAIVIYPFQVERR